MSEKKINLDDTQEIQVTKHMSDRLYRDIIKSREEMVADNQRLANSNKRLEIEINILTAKVDKLYTKINE